MIMEEKCEIESNDPEIEVMNKVYKYFSFIDYLAKIRVLTWLSSKIESDESKIQAFIGELNDKVNAELKKIEG